MAFGKSKSLAASAMQMSPEPPSKQRTSLVASALRFRFDDASYNYSRFRDEAWQREAFRLFKITPELHFAASWVGQCCSRVRIYVANVDEMGRIQGETRNKKIQALSDTLLGGPASKAEHLRMMGIDLTIVGECYIIGQPNNRTGRDQWFIVTPTEFRRIRGSNGDWDWAWGPKGAPMKLDTEKSIVTRVWTPDPERVWCADSPTRACQLILRELEQLTKLVAAEIDSRLVSNGILIIPNNLDLPAEENTTNNAESLMVRLATAGAASLRGEGAALGVLPHIIEAESADGFQHLTFSTELQKTAHDLRRECIDRLGVGMDMPPEVLTGTGGESHWNAYLIEGQGIKTHIEPIMTRICEALTEAYLVPSLQLMGEDPSRFTYMYDTSPLVVRTQRTQDALNLYEKGAISEEALREAAFFKNSDAPKVSEGAKRLLIDVLLRDPQLLQNQAIRHAVGIPEEVLPQLSMVAPTAQSISMGPGGSSSSGMGGNNPPMPPPTGIDDSGQVSMPDTMGNLGAPPGAPAAPGRPQGRPANASPGGGLNGPPPTGLTASAAQIQDMGVTVLAEATVRRALELAGKRLLNRDNRNRWPDVPAHDLHTRIKVQDQAHANRLLAGAWDQLNGMALFFADGFDTPKLQMSLERYCSVLLLRSLPHDPPNLYAQLQSDGVLNAD